MVLLLRRNLVKESVATAKKIGQRESVAATKKFGQRERGCLKTTYL